ncbi:MAG TPA: adenylosuccinate synthetase [Thermoleophilaceae bacterium]|jgi:adenylosuccinate synthase
MPLTVVVGGQYGSEGKGKLVSYLARSTAPSVAVVRCGGSNAGHTAEGSLGRALLRQLPSGAVEPACQLFLAAGMQLDLPVLQREIEQLQIGADRLCIDRGAVIIEPSDRTTEETHQLYDRIGSTLSGTGASAARKVLRDSSLRRAEDVPELRAYVGDVAEALATHLARGAHVVVEGTQGAGLSLHHGPYPYTTGRDTTAAAFLSEAGLAPMHVTDVLMVLRTYPIRVGGPSGPLHGELSWDEVALRSGYPTALAEYTTVTGRLRRIGEFDWPLARRAVRLNGPTSLAVHGADYLNCADLGVRSWDELSTTTRAFVECLERELGVPVRYVFTGPDGGDLVDRGGAHSVRTALHAPSMARTLAATTET